MNILFKKEHLSQAISTVSKAISTKTTNPDRSNESRGYAVAVLLYSL